MTQKNCLKNARLGLMNILRSTKRMMANEVIDYKIEIENLKNLMKMLI